MEITAQLVKELREKTGIGMMECKKALSETGGNFDEAIEYLRKRGLQASQSKAGRVAADGIVATYLSDNAKVGVLVELNSETDFVAKNDEFIKFARGLAQYVAGKSPADVESLLSSRYQGSETVQDTINLLISKIGEKISLRRFVRCEAGAQERLGVYLHLGSKIGVLVGLSGEGSSETLVKDIAMHIAASSPSYIEKSEIPQGVLEKEKEIYREQLKGSGKPDSVIDKIILGKVGKYSSEVCLNDQVYVKDPTGKKSVSQILKEVNAGLKVSFFNRYQVGEGLQKRTDDFAGEVAKMVS